MNPERVLQKYKEHTQRWIHEIDTFSPDTFNQSLAGGWSTAQVIDHIAKTTSQCLQNAGLCCNGKGEKGHSGFGPAIFSLMGSFPPVRIKVKTPPKGVEHIYTPLPISQQEAKNALQQAMRQMEDILQLVQQADTSYRIAHWAGGWFNAQQWYHSAEMHIKHHFRQLKRIKNTIRKTS
jgi:hypothetical protein